MRIHYPLTIIAAVVAFGLAVLGCAVNQVQTMQTDVASSWASFIASHLPNILPYVLIITVIAWLVERHLHRSRIAKKLS